MVARPGAPDERLAALVLENVVADLVEEDVTKKELPERRAWPVNGGPAGLRLLDARAGLPEPCSLITGETAGQEPGRGWLVVQLNLARADQAPELQSGDGSPPAGERDGFEAVARLFSEEAQELDDIGPGNGMGKPSPGPPDHDPGKRPVRIGGPGGSGRVARPPRVADSLRGADPTGTGVLRSRHGKRIRDDRSRRHSASQGRSGPIPRGVRVLYLCGGDVIAMPFD